MNKEKAKETLSALMFRRGCEEIGRFGQFCLEAEVHVVEVFFNTLETGRKGMITSLRSGGKMISLSAAESRELNEVLWGNHIIRIESFLDLTETILKENLYTYTSEMEFWQKYCRAVNPLLFQLFPIQEQKRQAG